ncbi:MAG: hypothetical protein DHS20C15_08150 [Planctomycetota bacterium]|nr:MAG: hypothetical protein DHS20C15_08150 [Planctomycetota bacterium]
MFALLLTAAAVFAAPFAPQDAEAKERDLRDEYKKGIARSDPQTRADAVNAYGFATRDLADDEGASKLVARQLKIALGDDEMEVVAAAIVALSWGRHVDTTLDGMEDVIDDLRNTAAKYATRPGDENRAVFQEAARLYENACVVVGRHTSDAAVDILVDQLRTLKPGTGEGRLAEVLVGPLSTALLELGSYEAVELVVKTTNVFGGEALSDDDEGNNFTRTARIIHDALIVYSEKIGKLGPPWSDRYDNDWRDWFKEVRGDLERKLGKLEEPIGPPDYVDPDERMRADQPKPGERERP